MTTMRKTLRLAQSAKRLSHEERIIRSLPFPKPLQFPSWITVEVDTLQHRSERLRIFAELSLRRIKKDQ
jgi:hypothetical protein